MDLTGFQPWYNSYLESIMCLDSILESFEV